ncbi:Di-copper centre-containing protein [Sodiomyces alkalinus F11]|uniref:Di-copper centre-containing protein n=1 Tax=Sodiomyces alkalinus (strain CBS 110278 / VKM F-3762 / F11) TaxID=1314773 RepID=A0A3N2Q6J7_SODAK|nr:Di-copper centre-containing protein [Sodiomyces alkalinus F11]ROT42391.1 Di-copper centre-containing protein [Sodiomyces alkalinus F11]
MMWAHEELLEQECGWTGGQPYWHEQIDAGHFINSTILDPVLGFGGDGDRTADDCIQDGPFANYTNQVGVGYDVREQCITRRVNETRSIGTSQERVDECLAEDTWEAAWPCIEGQPHGGGHAGIGGQMANPISSPGDPLFYLHHTWLDKIWWDWQKMDLPARLFEMSGQNLQGGNTTGDAPCGGEVIFPPRPDDVPEPVVEGDPGCATTLDHVLHMFGVVEDRTIREVMDIHGPLLRYDYVDPDEP